VDRWARPAVLATLALAEDTPRAIVRADPQSFAGYKIVRSLGSGGMGGLAVLAMESPASVLRAGPAGPGMNFGEIIRSRAGHDNVDLRRSAGRKNNPATAPVPGSLPPNCAAARSAQGTISSPHTTQGN